MSGWSLPTLLSGLHDDIQQKLATSRKAFGHPVAKGDSSEQVWLELLQTYLPKRYQAERAHVVDSQGSFSDAIDVVVFDRQYTPFIFNYNGQLIVPAEGVYGVFEAKQEITANEIEYAQNKVASVRRLHRTTLPIPYAEGTYKPKPPIHILGGILTFESSWSPPLGDAMRGALGRGPIGGELDLGCVAAAGHFSLAKGGHYELTVSSKAATAFLFELISRLQVSGTVSMIDIKSYAEWLNA